jgi:hypothetical protein
MTGERKLTSADCGHKDIIGGFVISSFTEFFVTEAVKEWKKPRNPQCLSKKLRKRRLKHAEGQVMIDWRPARKGRRRHTQSLH